MFYNKLILSLICILYSLSCEGRPGSESSLYTDLDKINLLNQTNLKSHIVGSETSWLVEFYSSWCGHCINFAPTYKLLAADVYAWRDIMAVGAIDCADEANTETCREYDIMGYPTMKFFPRKSSVENIGERVNVRQLTVEAIRDEMTAFLSREEQNKTLLTDKWPKLLPATVEKLSDLKYSSKPHTLLIVEEAESKVGMEVMLDLHIPVNRLNIPLQVRRTVFNQNAGYAKMVTTLPAVIYIGDNSVEPVLLSVKDVTRQGMYNSIKDYLWMESSKFALSGKKDAFDGEKKQDIDQKKEPQTVVDNSSKMKKNLISRRYTVYMSDLEKAAVYALSHEIAQHQTIAGEALEALRKFVTVLDKYFPSRLEFSSVLTDIHYWVHQHEDAIRGEDLGAVVKSSLNKYKVQVNEKWIGCQGSKPQYGGYPCGLWSLWHTLTINHSLKDNVDDKEILEAMQQYIHEYFGCRECARHFAQTIQNGDGITENVKSGKDSVLYLWMIHNKVNTRLSGDISEDPLYPKQVYPDKEFCFKCINPPGSIRGTNLWDEFDREEIYTFLVEQYSKKINKQGLKALEVKSSQIKQPANALAVVEDVGENLDLSNFHKKDNGRLTVNLIFFNGADLSLYMFLWLISAIMIIMLYLKFVNKKWLPRPGHFFSGNSKNSYNPLLGKV